MGWDFDEKFLYPKFDLSTNTKNLVSNNIINTSHLNVWKNYQDLLKPVSSIIKEYLEKK